MSKNLINSNKLQNRASKVIPHLTGTFSRNAHSFVEGVFPVYVKSANGSHFIDVDGNDYLDYLCGIGPITLGYNYKVVNDAIIQQLKDGILFSLPHPIEVELSELLSQTIPHAEMVKFEKSGSKTIAAISFGLSANICSKPSLSLYSKIFIRSLLNSGTPPSLLTTAAHQSCHTPPLPQ